MYWSNPPRWLQGCLLLLTCTVMAIPPIMNQIDRGLNKDYPLWYQVSQWVNQNEPIYPTEPNTVFPFMYPPFAAIVLAGLGSFGADVMFGVLILLNVLSLAIGVELCIRMVAGTSQVPLLLRTIPGAISLFFINDMFLLGQPNLGLLVLILSGLWLLQKHSPIWAGVLFATATAIKAFPAVVLCYLLYRRAWKAVLSMVIFLMILLVVVPAPIRGFERNLQELKTWANGMLFRQGENGHGQRPEQSVSWRNQSLFGVGHRLLRDVNAEADAFDAKVPPFTMNVLQLDYKEASLVLLGVAALLGMGYIGVMPKRAEQTAETNSLEWSLLLLLMTIGTPYAFSYYFVWLIFPLTVCCHYGLSGVTRADRRFGWGLIIGVTMLFALGVPSPWQHQIMALGNLFWATMLLIFAFGWKLRQLRRQE